MNFTEEQLKRYNRNILLKEIGLEGQEKITRAKILVIGVGGLGSPVLMYLAAAGIGTLGIVDNDVVDLSNLQRQIIHSTDDVKREKILSAKKKIQQLNPDVIVNAYKELVTAENITDILRDYDFIVDATDNFPAKFLINDACVIENKPFSHAGVVQFIGQTMTIVPGESACYRCVFHKPPASENVPGASRVGILGAVAGILGTIQAVEVMKFITGKGKLLTNSLLTVDALEMQFRKISVKRKKMCLVCGESRQLTSLMDYEQNLKEL